MCVFLNFFFILDSYLTTSQTIENLPELDLEAHYIDPITSNDPEVQKVLFNKSFITYLNHSSSFFKCYLMLDIGLNGHMVSKHFNNGVYNVIDLY